jgi:hypothetical protein
MYTQDIDSFAKDAHMALRLFEHYEGLSDVLPWQYWAASNAALLLEKSKQFTLSDRLAGGQLEQFDLTSDEGFKQLDEFRRRLNYGA